MKLKLKLILGILGILTRIPLYAQTHQVIDIEQLLTNLSQTENSRAELRRYLSATHPYYGRRPSTSTR